MKQDIINIDQSEYWNEKSGPKWVKLDDAMNERFSILTDELFARANINNNERILDIGCGAGETSFRASKLVGPDGYVMGCLLYTSPSPRDRQKSRMPSSA